MRHSVIVVLCLLGFCIPLKAQYEGNGASIIIRGGYNFLEKGEVYDLSVVQDFVIFRGKVEIGASKLYLSEMDAVKYVTYFAPSIGLVYGEKSNVYLLFGGSSWGKKVFVDNRWKISDESWNFKVEGGVDIAFTRVLFLNLEVCYFIPHVKNPESYFQNLCLKAGIGFNF